ncbi:DUF4339 domain-containing protein [Bradyrhizobium guangxiense]|uniref:DUF4339 domain-containing protein n=1 Tax=Bradyrhizobium guangxiense TaxID=1325115 RepID=UPI0013E8D961|nr:DUF4339 domain-containing protein [Bradyrhizobium guangxiense]
MSEGWYYANGDQSLGPVSIQELVRALNLLSEPGAALIWKNGFSEWQAARSVPEVAAWLGQRPPQIRPTPRLETPKARRVVRTEKRKRGFFGWLFLIVFLLFNGLMAAWLFSYWSQVLPMTTNGSDAGRAGAAIGTTMGTGLILSLWTCGSLVLGLFVLFTRGRKVIVEEERN